MSAMREMTATSIRCAIALCVLAAAGCDDRLDQRLAIVDEPRVLAVIGEPAEALPGSEVHYRALLGGPGGPIDAAPRWSFCTAPKPPTEDNAVATGCIDGTALLELGEAPEVTAALPADGCILFGPDVPPGNYRPRDPDPTGGYYQPVRVAEGELLAFGLSRITCKLGNAPAEVARDYDLRYRANTNPVLDPIELTEVAAGAAVELRASWPASAVETYLYYDQLAQVLVERREAMRVSWFATGGSIDVDATAVGEDEQATSDSATWHAPAAGPASIWFVLRDSRGGIAVQHARIDVR